jgi:hypothetical protein
MPAEDYVIDCASEDGKLLSNKRGISLWEALFDLTEILSRNGRLNSGAVLFVWKSDQAHRAAAREPYAWREVIEEIKNSDLTKECSGTIADREKLVLMTDKPTMLKIAGEITNALMHSYSSGHSISFKRSV